MEELKHFLKERQPFNLVIVMINLVVFLILSFAGNVESAEFMLRHGANYAPLVVEGKEYYRLITSMFLHFGFEHLINNMLILIFLGDALEQLGGRFRYLLIYIGGGIAGNILSVMWDMKTGSFAVSAGASGAVFAVIGALVFVVLRGKGRIEGMTGRRLIFMAVLSILEGFTSSGVDNSAHIGGMAAGFLLALLTNTGRKRDKTRLSFGSSDIGGQR